ncbi:MAG: aspartate aminotransferase family protein [Vicinamibacterales bacterium]
MSDLTPDRNADMQYRQAPLAMDAATFRVLGRQLVDQIATLLEAVPHGPVTRERTPTSVRQALALTGPLPEDGEAAGPLLERTARLLFEQSLFNAHPRFFGYITASAAPIGILGDFLASALNSNVGAWALSPAATEVESQAIRWIASLIQYHPSCGGIFVSGGNMANIVCFLAARAAKAPWNVREQGVAGAPQLRVYCSAETHTWIQKAADVSGLGTASIRWIPTDSRLRMDPRLLRQRIDGDLAAGNLPFLVVGTAGSVSTGAIDPLPELRAICTTYGLWFHVDGAYGGFANALPDAPGDLRGLSDADSVAVDPHKWLYAPLEAGCALVRDAESLRAAFAYHPPYYHFGETATNFVDFGMQNSRGFRALKVWLALKQVGASGYRAMIADDIRLSQALAHAVDRHPDLELIGQNLSITVFRYVPANLRAGIGQAEAEQQLDAINRELLDRLQRGGDAFVSNAVVAGRYALRACIVNYHTAESDVNALPEIVARVGRGVARQ